MEAERSSAKAYPEIFAEGGLEPDAPMTEEEARLISAMAANKLTPFLSHILTISRQRRS